MIIQVHFDLTPFHIMRGVDGNIYTDDLDNVDMDPIKLLGDFDWVCFASIIPKSSRLQAPSSYLGISIKSGKAKIVRNENLMDLPAMEGEFIARRGE